MILAKIAFAAFHLLWESTVEFKMEIFWNMFKN